MDLVFIGLVVLVFAVIAGMVLGCDRLGTRP